MNSIPKPLRAIPLGILLALTSCLSPQATVALVDVEIHYDGTQQQVSVPLGSTSAQVIEAAGVTLGELDRLDPPGYTVVSPGTAVRVSRVTERFEILAIELPFQRQTIRNEGLPEGETRLLQTGQTGLQETTYRILEEEGEEISRTPIKTTTLREAQPEILMVGVQASYTTLPVEGTLAYVSGGNAWLMRGDSGNRRPIVFTGDLDGRVFELSPDGAWLLFTRRADDQEDEINSLWVVSTTSAATEPIDLGGRNIVHFAAWSPLSETPTLAYSTAEASPSPPGWQANNDLVLVEFDPSELSVDTHVLVSPNAGGQYGWWGTSFAWSPSGKRLAFARADSVGIIPLDSPAYLTRHEVVPFQTLGDWAWVPGIAWGADSQTLFLVEHGEPVGLENPIASPVFSLSALRLSDRLLVPLVNRTGMFAYPSTSPALELPSGEVGYQVAFLQAISPLDSADSHYRLHVMDRDGSNKQLLFPLPGETGLEPQRVAWSPSGDHLALKYQGDLWIIDSVTGLARQVTGDGQAMAYDWKP